MGKFSLFSPFVNFRLPSLRLCGTVGIEFIITGMGGLDREIGGVHGDFFDLSLRVNIKYSIDVPS